MTDAAHPPHGPRGLRLPSRRLDASRDPLPPVTVLILVPSVWEERLTGKFCERLNLRDSYIAVETRDALERRDLRLWRNFSWVGSSYSTLKDVSAQGSPGGGRRTESPGRKRASIPGTYGWF